MRIDKNSWLITKPIAHRGLWNETLPENSFPAYENAIKHSFAIEIDVFKTTDGKLVCFHDNDLKRMTNADGKIWDFDYKTLSSLSLLDSNEKIPLFLDVLKLCENKTPLLIEIKNQPDKSVVDDVVSALKNYKGEFAVQSFNPLYLRKIKRLAPSFIRGVLGTASKGGDASKMKKFLVKHMALNFLVKPDFISYDFIAYPLKERKVKRKVKLAWTITSEDEYKTVKPFVDNIIFEKFIPKK